MLKYILHGPALAPAPPLCPQPPAAGSASSWSCPHGGPGAPEVAGQGAPTPCEGPGWCGGHGAHPQCSARVPRGLALAGLLRLGQAEHPPGQHRGLSAQNAQLGTASAGGAEAFSLTRPWGPLGCLLGRLRAWCFTGRLYGHSPGQLGCAPLPEPPQCPSSSTHLAPAPRICSRSSLPTQPTAVPMGWALSPRAGHYPPGWALSPWAAHSPGHAPWGTRSLRSPSRALRQAAASTLSSASASSIHGSGSLTQGKVTPVTDYFLNSGRAGTWPSNFPPSEAELRAGRGGEEAEGREINQVMNCLGARLASSVSCDLEALFLLHLPGRAGAW